MAKGRKYLVELACESTEKIHNDLMEEISEINCIPDEDSQFIIEDLLGNADTWEMVDCFTQALDDLNIDWLNVEVIEED